VLQVPELDISVADRDKIASIFRKGNCFDFGTDFIAGNFDADLPVPNIDYHVVLGADGDNVPHVGRKGLQEIDRLN